MTTREAVERSARRLMRLRNPHRDLARAMRRLAERRHDNPLADLPVVTTEEVLALIELPDSSNTRPPTLLDRYPHGLAEHHHATRRLVAAGLRHSQPS